MPETIRFIHAADLHLDSPCTGISDMPDSLAEKLRKSTFTAFSNLIRTAIEQAVDFVVIAGDVFDSQEQSLKAQLAFRDGMVTLSKAGIRAFVVNGNHDPLQSWGREIVFPDTVTFFPGDAVVSHTVEKNGTEIATVSGISFARRAVTENLAVMFEAERPDIPSIAVLHCMIGTQEGHDPYAPAKLSDLTSRNFDYWALGHVHKQMTLNESHPTIVYSGNTQGRHMNEIGARGCLLGEIDDRRQCRLRFIPLDTIRFYRTTIDISSLSTFNALADEIISAGEEAVEDVDAVVRITLQGRTGLNRDLRNTTAIQELLENIRERVDGQIPEVWFESLRLETASPYNLDVLGEDKGIVGDILRLYEELESEDGILRKEFLSSLEEITSKWSGARYLSPLTSEDIKNCIDEARWQTLDNMLQDK